MEGDLCSEIRNPSPSRYLLSFDDTGMVFGRDQNAGSSWSSSRCKILVGSLGLAGVHGRGDRGLLRTAGVSDPPRNPEHPYKPQM